MRYLMTLALLSAGVALVQSTVTSTESALWRCRDSSGAALSRHTGADRAEEACSNHALAPPGQALEMRPSSFGITATIPVAATSSPTPVPMPHPAPNSAEVPLSFNDSVYANVTSGTSRITLPPGSSRTDLSIVENSGEPTIVCKGSCSLTRVRIQSREGVRCVSGNINLTWVYITATGVGSDHADGLQCYSPGSTGAVTVKNSTFKMAGATTAGYFSADNWQGSHVFENVLFEGGNHGLRIPADGGSSVSLKNVYFVRGSFRYGAYQFDVVNGRRINIEQWENVRWASWRGDELVLGDLIKRP
ncbi:hypothetical protein V1273_002174 [Bradyrhizobium sp. AZCC 1721]